MEKGRDKVKQICDIIRKEAIDPAVIEADTLIDEAKAKAEGIIAKARLDAEEILLKSRHEMEQKEMVFKVSLQQAVKQTLEELRQRVENKFFRDSLTPLIQKEMKDTKVLAQLINAIIKALEKEGISANLSAIIPKEVSARAVNELLLKEVIDRLKQKGVEGGEIQGGVIIKILGEKISLEITDEVLKNLLSQYIRKDFRELFFT